MNLRCSILGAVLLAACGGASETEDERDERAEDRLAAKNTKSAESGGDAADAEPAAPATVTTIIITTAAPPPSAVPVAAAPVIVAPSVAAPASPADDPPLVGTPVDPDTWLAAESEQSPLAEVAADGGVAGELRVDDLTVLVIFDNSGSMSTYWDGGTRWEIANRSLVVAIEPVQTSLKVGAIRFPMVTSCGVPDFRGGAQFGFELGQDFLARWIEGGLAPEGGTPLAQAFIEADEAIARAGEMGLLEDRFNVLVITDGEPNCEGNTELLTELPAKWRELGVATIVLGLPGSTEAATLLDAIAEAGGTHAHQSLGTAEELDRSVTASAR